PERNRSGSGRRWRRPLPWKPLRRGVRCRAGRTPLHPAVVAAVFPVIFIGELPDKTMFASVVMASRGHPRAVWVGAAGAFAVHVVIATTVGVGLVHLLPHRAVEALV